MRPYKPDEIGFFLVVGEHFIGVDLASKEKEKEKEKAGIDHFCMGVEVTTRALF